MRIDFNNKANWNSNLLVKPLSSLITIIMGCCKILFILFLKGEVWGAFKKNKNKNKNGRGERFGG